MYSLNREHLAAPFVIGISRLRNSLWDKVRTELRRGPVQPIYAAAFGSAIRRDHDTESDIDLFLVSGMNVDEARWDAIVGRLSSRVTRWTGNDARVLHMPEFEVRRQIEHQPVLSSIVKQNVHLIGDPSWLSTLFDAARHRAQTGGRNGSAAAMRSRSPRGQGT